MNTQQERNLPSYMCCMDTLEDSLTKAISLAHVTRMAHEHENNENIAACRGATTETMRMIVELLDKAQGAKQRIHELSSNKPV